MDSISHLQLTPQTTPPRPAKRKSACAFITAMVVGIIGGLAAYSGYDAWKRRDGLVAGPLPAKKLLTPFNATASWNIQRLLLDHQYVAARDQAALIKEPFNRDLSLMSISTYAHLNNETDIAVRTAHRIENEHARDEIFRRLIQHFMDRNEYAKARELVVRSISKAIQNDLPPKIRAHEFYDRIKKANPHRDGEVILDLTKKIEDQAVRDIGITVVISEWLENGWYQGWSWNNFAEWKTMLSMISDQHPAKVKFLQLRIQHLIQYPERISDARDWVAKSFQARTSLATQLLQDIDQAERHHAIEKEFQDRINAKDYQGALDTIKRSQSMKVSTNIVQQLWHSAYKAKAYTVCLELYLMDNSYHDSASLLRKMIQKGQLQEAVALVEWHPNDVKRRQLKEQVEELKNESLIEEVRTHMARCNGIAAWEAAQGVTWNQVSLIAEIMSHTLLRKDFDLAWRILREFPEERFPDAEYRFQHMVHSVVQKQVKNNAQAAACEQAKRVTGDRRSTLLQLVVEHWYPRVLHCDLRKAKA